jgi:glycerol 3-phosphatase-2
VSEADDARAEAGLPAGDPHDWFRRARDLLEQGNAAASLVLIDRVLEVDSTSLSAVEIRARALFDSRNFSEAAAEFERITLLRPDDDYAQYGLGMSLWRLQRFPEAADHLALAAVMRPSDQRYVQALTQVRATLKARVEAGLPLEGPIGADPGGEDAAVRAAQPIVPGMLIRDVWQPPVPVHSHQEFDFHVVPAQQFDVALLDLDGVVYVGECAVEHAVTSIEKARNMGMTPAFVTNNASRTPDDVASHLQALGLKVTSADVVTSAQAGAHALERVLRDRGEAGPVLAVGGPGVAAALRERGMTVVDTADQHPVAVLQGFGREISWSNLAEASIAVGRGAIWVATNPDTSIPTPRGRAPGNGAFIHAVRMATGRTPDVVAGKPHRPLIEESLERTGARQALMIGDRLDTDIEAGVNAGIPTLLVMTGVTDVVDVLLARSTQRPSFISLDLRGLLHDFAPVTSEGDTWRCGGISLAVDETVSRCDLAGVQPPGVDLSVAVRDPLVWSATMRCLAHALWHRADQSHPPARDHVSDAPAVSEGLREILLGLPVVTALQGTVDQVRRLPGE